MVVDFHLLTRLDFEVENVERVENCVMSVYVLLVVDTAAMLLKRVFVEMMVCLLWWTVAVLSFVVALTVAVVLLVTFLVSTKDSKPSAPDT